MEYLGRIDDQVKIRGYRIELGEIEQALTSHQKTGQCVVIARALNQGADKELIAYTTGEATAEDLKVYLKERLPSYMVPNYYVKLEKIPLTSNGKIDRKALPDPEGTGMQQAKYVAPRTAIERQLIKIWSTFLGVEESTLSIKADFFDLGGNSLKLIKLNNKINNQFNKDFKLRDMFENSTIFKMSLKFKEIEKNKSRTFYRLNSKVKNGHKLLMFPPSKGEGMIYHNLAKLLEGKIEIWTMDYVKKNRKVDIKNYAFRISKSIKFEFGTKKIILGGYSLGFRFAYHIANIMEEQVVKLINIDSPLFRNKFEEYELSKAVKKIEIDRNEVGISSQSFCNEYFDKRISIDIVHFIGSNSIIKNYIPECTISNVEIIYLEGDHSNIFDSNKNLLSIYSYLID